MGGNYKGTAGKDARGPSGWPPLEHHPCRANAFSPIPPVRGTEGVGLRREVGFLWGMGTIRELRAGKPADQDCAHQASVGGWVGGFTRGSRRVLKRDWVYPTRNRYSAPMAKRARVTGMRAWAIVVGASAPAYI